MPKYYHVARNLDLLQPGQILNSKNWDRDHDTFTKIVADLLPIPFSEHGIRYVGKIDQKPNEDSSGIIEFLAEFIRQSHFPTRPSRFSSLFAWKYLDDARRFAERFVQSNPDTGHQQYERRLSPYCR